MVGTPVAKTQGMRIQESAIPRPFQNPQAQAPNGRGFEARVSSAQVEPPATGVAVPRHSPAESVRSEIAERAAAHVRGLRTDNTQSHVRAGVPDGAFRDAIVARASENAQGLRTENVHREVKSSIASARVQNHVVEQASAHVKGLVAENVREAIRAERSDPDPDPVVMPEGGPGVLVTRLQDKLAVDIQSEITERVRGQLIEKMSVNLEEQVKHQISEKVG